MEYLGKVLRASSVGLVFIEKENSGGKQFVSTLDKIKGYRGQYLKELKSFSPRGLKEGCLVMFTLDDSGEKVASVRPIVFAHKS